MNFKKDVKKTEARKMQNRRTTGWKTSPTFSYTVFVAVIGGMQWLRRGGG